MRYTHADTGKALEPAPGSFLADLVEADPLWVADSEPVADGAADVETDIPADTEIDNDD